MSRIRTFIGIDFPDSIKKSLNRFGNRLAPWATNVRWTNTELIHLTMLFLGDVEDQRVHDICRATKAACAETAPFEISLQGIRFFPKKEKPRVVSVNIDTGKTQLETFRANVAKHVDEAGFQFDWRFQPHVTIGRFGRGKFDDHALLAKVEELDVPDFGPTDVTRLTVFSSTLERDGPIYVPLAVVPLNIKAA